MQTSKNNLSVTRALFEAEQEIRPPGMHGPRCGGSGGRTSGCASNQGARVTERECVANRHFVQILTRPVSSYSSALPVGVLVVFTASYNGLRLRSIRGCDQSPVCLGLC